jgi:hypothetical protein
MTHPAPETPDPDCRRTPWRPAWPANFVLLALIGVPAFSGYPLARWPAEIVGGVTWAWAAYLGLVLLAVRWLLGGRMCANVIAVASLVTLPVVFAGGTLSWLALHVTFGGADAALSGSHYVKLCLTMLSVIPLALALVSVVPFGQMEGRLLMHAEGVTAGQKKILMILRVFNHIAFEVLPGTLEILREEGLTDGRRLRIHVRCRGVKAALADTLGDLIHLAVGTICAALQYIPLWANEIGRLPERPPKR